MEENNIFTVDRKRYPLPATQQFLQEQKEQGRMVIAILDPGVTVKHGLPAYDKGIDAGLFIRRADNQAYYVDHVWPGLVHFIDFFAAKSKEYWLSLLASFHKVIPYDGLWLDMCEPASLQPGNKEIPRPPNSHSFDPNYPPFAINNGDEELDIFIRTINMDTLHVDDTRHISLHNAYGLAESTRTAESMEAIQPGKRHFILTRSTFPGSGRFTAHWLGDNFSEFEHMRYSIAGILDFQLFGIPMVGADICGFLGSTSMELCARWMALGSFYPFARNHNAERLEFISQEPYRWPEVAAVTRKYFGLRYSLLPYWYTLLHLAHETGRPVIRPLFFEFPQYHQVFHDIDEVFMVGSSILVAPVLSRGANRVDFLIPPGVWYDIINYNSRPIAKEKPELISMRADLQTLPVLLRGGHALLKQIPKLTISETLESPYELLIALDRGGRANGYVYFDDGESSDPGQAVTKLYITATCGLDSCTVRVDSLSGYRVKAPINNITILSTEPCFCNVAGVQVDENSIMLDGADAVVEANALTVQNLQIDLNRSFCTVIFLHRPRVHEGQQIHL